MSQTRREQIQLTTAQILADLNDGLTRDEIGTKYGLTKSDVVALFKHPDLLGKKTKVRPGFIIVETVDTSNAVPQNEAVSPTTEDSEDMEDWGEPEEVEISDTV